jgi:hypothetical protein
MVVDLGGRHDELDGYFSSPHDAPPKWMLMLTAYIDESGHESKGWMFLAGFLGNEDQWKGFVPLWKSALGPQRKHLHMSDLRWNSTGTKNLLARLGTVPNMCGLTPVLTGVRYSDYEDLVSGSPFEKSLKGWLVCLLPLILQILRVVPDGERLEVVFEEQNQYEPFAHKALGTIAELNGSIRTVNADGKPKLAKWSFVPKGSTIMTDAADYFAFALRAGWTDKKSKKAIWSGPIMQSGNGNGIGYIMKRKDVRRNIQDTYVLAAFDLLHQMQARY